MMAIMKQIACLKSVTYTLKVKHVSVIIKHVRIIISVMLTFTTKLEQNRRRLGWE